MGKYSRSCTGQYLLNGAITLQRLVDDWILEDAGLTDVTVARNGARFLPFPTKEYVQSGFYQNIARKCISCPVEFYRVIVPKFLPCSLHNQSIRSTFVYAWIALPNCINHPVYSPGERVAPKRTHENDVSN